jgi:long-subunit fatty acid transport protein
MHARGLLVGLAMLAARDARASTLDLFGFGMRAPALAGTGVATANDYESVYANPAGLAEVTEKRATVGAVIADFRTKMAGSIVGDSSSGTVLGGVVPIPLEGWAKGRFVLGFGFYVPNQALNRVRAPFPGVPQFALLENRSHVIAIQIGVGMQLDEKLSLGVTAIVLAALRGGIDVTTDASANFSADSEQRLIAQFSPVLGAKWKASKQLTYGVTARAPVRSDYDILVTSDLGEALPLELPEIRIAGTAQYDPLIVAAEVAWRPRENLLLAGHLAYHRWSAYPLPTKNPVPGTPAQQPPGFEDRPVPRLAVEWTQRAGSATFAARAGYAFMWSPAPEMTGQQSLLDNHRHVTSVGFGTALSGKLPVRIDVFAQWHHLQRRTHTKDPELQLEGEIPVFDKLGTSGNVFVAGAALGLDL